MTEKYYRVAKGIAEYLARKQEGGGGFPARSFYGEAFSILLWSYFGEEFKDNISKAIDRYRQKDKSGTQFHWEFNNYALYHYYRRTGDSRIPPLLKNSKFKGTKSTNWMLLRAITRLYRKRVLDNIIARLEINICLSRQKQGFFLDEPDVRSFQYHCFSTALMGELFELTGNDEYKHSFLRGVDFISNFIMPNGDTLYIGRGQEQIFGYGALIFILEFAYKMTDNKSYKKNAREVLSYLLRFQRKDGSFPLVLREGEEGYPRVVNTEDERFLGWYAYNNFFDYLPFLGFYLMRADEIGVSRGTTSKPTVNSKNRYETFRHNDYLVYSSYKYKAVVSKPGGYWTNDMPFPYICYKNESLFPCYGGEQFVESVYSVEQIPLPFGKTENGWMYFRELNYTIERNSLSASSEDLYFTRTFDFMENGFRVIDRTAFKRDVSFEEFYPINLYFFNLKQVGENVFETEYNNAVARVMPSKPCSIVEGKFCCARGRLKALRERILDVSYAKNDGLERTIEVVLE